VRALEESQIDRYVVLDRLGEGGMGAVLRVRDVGTGREHALKVIRPEELDPSSVARFHREVEALAKLDHPGIVRIRGAGRTPPGVTGYPAGLPYYVMDLVKGEALDAVIKRRKQLPPAEAAALVGAIAEAMAHAHANGIVHRDLKPKNVILAEGGRPIVIDFGLAVIAESTERITRTGVLVGSPHFMSPEQAAGDPITPATDVWAIGSLLYALLTGKLPFERTSLPALLAAIQLDEPAPPSKLAPGLPKPLDELCLRCLSKKATARPDARALALALLAIARRSGEPRIVAWARGGGRRGAIVLASALAAAAAVGAGGGALVESMMERRERAKATALARVDRAKELERVLIAVLPLVRAERSPTARRDARVALDVAAALAEAREAAGLGPLEPELAARLAIARAVVTTSPETALAALRSIERPADDVLFFEAELAFEVRPADALAALEKLAKTTRESTRAHALEVRARYAIASALPDDAPEKLDQLAAATEIARDMPGALDVCLALVKALRHAADALAEATAGFLVGKDSIDATRSGCARIERAAKALIELRPDLLEAEVKTICSRASFVLGDASGIELLEKKGSQATADKARLEMISGSIPVAIADLELVLKFGGLDPVKREAVSILVQIDVARGDLASAEKRAAWFAANPAKDQDPCAATAAAWIALARQDVAKASEEAQRADAAAGGRRDAVAFDARGALAHATLAAALARHDAAVAAADAVSLRRAVEALEQASAALLPIARDWRRGPARALAALALADASRSLHRDADVKRWLATVRAETPESFAWILDRARAIEGKAHQ
jgi:hypothetical protein